MYELVHPLRFLGGRRVVWIETGVVELLPPSVAPEQPSEEQS
jgi:hypothetical protein